ncbi:MAG: transcriptional regulator [Nitrospirae bacterium]|nr:transcriptional regulator [Nitrospirota bacterium]
MKKKLNKTVPKERNETVRHEIVKCLEGAIFSAKEISTAVGIPERDVYEHMEHIQRSMSKKEHQLKVTPAECKKCGFIFSKREKLKKPSRCPICKAETIYEPLFSIVQ